MPDLQTEEEAAKTNTLNTFSNKINDFDEMVRNKLNNDVKKLNKKLNNDVKKLNKLSNDVEKLKNYAEKIMMKKLIKRNN